MQSYVQITHHYEMFNHRFCISYSLVWMLWFYSVNVGTVYYYISKCTNRMQIHWNASSFKNRYIELLELEQYKLSGQTTRQHSGSDSMLHDTYIYLVVRSKLWRWYDRTMRPQKVSYFIFTIPICILFSICIVNSWLHIGRTPKSIFSLGPEMF